MLFLLFLGGKRRGVLFVSVYIWRRVFFFVRVCLLLREFISIFLVGVVFFFSFFGVYFVWLCCCW